MKLQFKAEKRAEQGTGASRRLRREGRLPGIIYGAGEDAQPITMDHNELYHLMRKEVFHSSVLTVELDGKKENVILRDSQWHPYKPQVLHIDFQVVDLAKPVRVKVPLHLINGDISPAVKLHSNRISQLATTVELLIKPNEIPEFLELDLKDLVGGQILHVSDVPLPAGAVSTALHRGANPAVAAAGKKR